MAKSGKIADVEKYRKGVFAREDEGTTGIGMGIAIPHCKSDAVKKAGLAAMVVKNGVDFESLDALKSLSLRHADALPTLPHTIRPHQVSDQTAFRCHHKKQPAVKTRSRHSFQDLSPRHPAATP